MSDLQLSLIVLALLAIGGIWLFNVVVDRMRRRAFEQRVKPRTPPPTPTQHVVPGAPSPAREEPSFKLGGATPVVEEIEPTVDAPVVPEVEATIVDKSFDRGAYAGQMVDEEIHAVVTLEPESLLSGERAWSMLHAFRHAGRQPVLLFGVRGDIQEPIRTGQRYEMVLVAVQLANRSGPLNEIEWSEFVAALQHVSEQIPASCEIPDMRETTTRARALDALCVPLDAQIGINLTGTQAAWSGEHVAALARQHGLILRPDGRFHAIGDHGITLFVLQNGDGGAFRADTLDAQSTSRLTLLLDVPRAPKDQQPFARLVALANELAVALDAAIVDDQSRVLTANALASIGRQIDPVYEKLASAGMPAGSPRALALFG